MLTTLFGRNLRQSDDESAGSPKEINRRIDRRYEVTRYNGVVKSDGLSHQFRLRNLSCTGVSGLTAAPVHVGQTLKIELVKGLPRTAIVRWTRGTSVGLSFWRPLPHLVMSAILEADHRHCGAANDGDLDLGPLPGVELGIVSCVSDETDDSSEDSKLSTVAPADIRQEPSAKEVEEIEDCIEASEKVLEDGVAIHATSERRSEPRIRTLLRIAKITSSNDSGLCCLRSLSDSGLMAETDLALEAGDEVQFDLSDRHRLDGRVVWKDEAGIGVALTEAVDSISLLSQLAEDGVGRRSRAPRLSISKRAVAYSEAGLHHLSVVDISQRGMRAAHSGDLTTGLAVKVRLENGFEVRAIVRWSHDDSAGLEFLSTIPYQILNSVSDF